MQRDGLNVAGVPSISEEKVSDKAAGRPELGHCLKALRAGGTLAVWRLARLERSLPDLVRIVAEREDGPIGFESITEKIETSSAVGRRIVHVMAALAEFERNLIRERTQVSCRSARTRPGWRSKAEAGCVTKREIKRPMSDPIIPGNQIAQRYKVSRTTIYKVAPRSLKAAVGAQAGCSYTGEIPNERGRNRIRNSDTRPILLQNWFRRRC
ncbi:MAG: recombinase family protein [Paraburkholderia sp.]|uniref:recombinase family protein n=1 Tax=Paraburkholderia sp. TaxID=1926495 RepID=UPI003C5694EC